MVAARITAVVRALALLLLALPGGSSAQVAGATSPGAVPVLRPGDVVRLEVRDEPEMSGEYGVGPGGDVLLPLVGTVAVADRPFDEVIVEVRRRYATELAEVELRLVPVYRIAVLGEVRAPGLYPVDPTHDLGQVLALAGGLAPDADPGSVSLIRGGSTLFRTSVEELMGRGVVLRSGDEIWVDEKSWLRQNLGLVFSTGASLGVAVVTGLLLR